MAFALLIIGIVLLTSAIRGTQDYLVMMVRSDFTGANNFTYWIVALLLVGSIGYVDRFKKVSDALLVLILIALILTKGSPAFPGGGAFKQIQEALKSTEGRGFGTTNIITSIGPGGVTIGPAAPVPVPGRIPGTPSIIIAPGGAGAPRGVNVL